MIVLGVLLAMAQLQQPAGAVQSTQWSYIILASDADRPKLEKLLSVQALGPDAVSASDQSGMFYVSCVSAWRGNPQQSELCIRSRLGKTSERLMILNAYGAGFGPDQIALNCIWPAKSGSALIARGRTEEAAQSVQNCLKTAASEGPDPQDRLYGVRRVNAFAFQDPNDARSAAPTLLILAVDHAGVPRGNSGQCLVSGRLVRVARGAGLSPRGRIELAIPCVALADPNAPRRIPMAEFRAGTFAAAYFDAQQTLLDFHRVSE